MWGVAGVAALLLILVLASGAQARTKPKTAAPSLPPAPGDGADVVARANLTADPSKLDEHAAEAERAGYPQTAAAIRARALRIRDAEPSLVSTPGARDLKSPVPEASAAAWTRFVELMAGNNASNTVSPNGELGLFQFSIRRLADLGYVTNPRKDASGKWIAEWVPPLSRDGFLSDLKLQYKAFVKATVADRAAILARHRDAIGRTLASKTATLSGLLGAARQAGLRGLAAWLASNADRTKFPRTTAAYLRSNGLY
jgi:hypothetical protein